MGRRPINLSKRRPRGLVMPITTGVKVEARDGESVQSMLARLKDIGHRQNSIELQRRQKLGKINGVNHTLRKGELKVNKQK